MEPKSRREIRENKERQDKLRRLKEKREAARRKKQQIMIRRGIIAAVALIAVIGAAIGFGRNLAPKTPDLSAHFVEDEGVEVLAPPFVVEDESHQAPLTEDELAKLFGSQPTVPPMLEAATSITITAVGDCTLGGESGSFRRFHQAVDSHGMDYFFDNVRDIFEADDLTLVNLEGPLTNATAKRKNRVFNFRGKPENVGILAGSSVEVANVANNHALDYQQKGFQDTLDVLSENGISACGFGETSIREVNGIKVGFMGFNTWDHKESEMRKAIEKMDSECDLLVVSMHWGDEKRYEATKEQVSLGHMAVDAGADLVIGTHSHVCGGIENYNGVQIVYSLGNFCFGGNENPFDTDAYIYQQTFVFDGENALDHFSAKVYPVSVTSSKVNNNYQPTLLTGSDAQRVLRKIADVSEEKGLSYVTAVVE